jgi:hypothetical protein
LNDSGDTPALKVLGNLLSEAILVKPGNCRVRFVSSTIFAESLPDNGFPIGGEQ